MKSLKKHTAVCLVMAMFMMIATAGMVIAEERITGTIAEKGEIIVLDAADGSYILEGGEMTPEMIGKTVKVTGTVEVKNDMRVITVLSMEEIAE